MTKMVISIQFDWLSFWMLRL